MNKKKVVVCGGTGHQGGAVVNALINQGTYEVSVVSRDPGGSASAALENSGARVLQGDFHHLGSLQAAFRGAFAVFGVTQPWSGNTLSYDADKEIIQGKNIIWACKTEKVSHLVFSSFFRYNEKESGVSFIDSKFVLEAIIGREQVPYTILRPGLYFDQLEAQFRPGHANLLCGNYQADTLVPYVALSDIGRYCASVIADPGRYSSMTIPLVSEFIPGKDIAGSMTAAFEKEVSYRSKNKILLRLFQPEIYNLRRYFERMNSEISPASLLALTRDEKHPFLLQTLADFLKSRVPVRIADLMSAHLTQQRI
ncbi:NmrA family NAD(P)-binding protein [Mucilaginibacter sp. UR6-1]|uniref:NmrA family NAD(P)-binding protein n=1 Tax=Mucilaginibacter sp. UR6-1 TaxID=1435643 RepID=UPI001E4D09B0|nr:NmrA family NAD(P)-binding protein [Mucilaginibacter sp. UR6-1]MCC8407760.1 NmrA family NAD(P)-binding protein [Mucilaginibacter sp. UR6-1]